MHSMPHPRRSFLGWIGGTSLLGAAGFPSLSGRALPRDPADHAAPVADKWDVSWTDRVNGKYRAVFDSPEPAEGAALFRAVAWCDMYKDVYGADRTEMSPVVVFRHSAIPLVMNHAYWESYEIGKELKLRDAKGKKWAKANPISVASAPATGPASKYKIETFLASGGVVLACDWAFNMVVDRIRSREKLERAAARARALELMIPGVILQPNGVFGVLRAQEAGCHYVMAS
jgi:hypothetical protein